MNIQLLEAFRKELLDLENHWFLFVGFFGTDCIDRDTRQKILYPSSPMFFNLVKLRFYDHIIMQLAKLLDPKQTGQGKNAKTNLSLYRLLHDFAPFSPEDNIKLKQYLDKINENSGALLIHRKKRIAHNDLENKLDCQLPSLEIHKIGIVIDALEEAFNLISAIKTGRRYEFSPVNVADELKPEYLVKIITHGRSSLGI